MKSKPNNLLELTNVSYFNDKVILNGIDLKIKEGETYFLVGENGSGKTTLLSILLKDIKPTSGNVNTYFEQKELAVVYNDVEFFPLLKVKELIHYLCKFYKIDYEDVQTKFFHELSLELVLNSKIKVLSSGEKQKLNILFALMKSPKIIILDEPFTNIDPLILKKIICLIHTYCETIIITTHNWEIIKEKTSIVCFLKNGQLFGMHTLEAYLKSFPPLKVITEEVLKFEKNILSYKTDNSFVFLFNERKESDAFIKQHNLKKFSIAATDLTDIYEIQTK